jgi:hypothetical protein
MLLSIDLFLLCENLLCAFTPVAFEYLLGDGSSIGEHEGKR